MKRNVASYVNTIFYFVVVTGVMVFAFLMRAPEPEGVVSWVFYLTLFSYYGLAVLLAGLVVYPLFWSRWTCWIIPLVFWVWLVYLVVYFAVFGLYQFHVDLLIIEMLFFDFRGMGIPAFLLGLSAILLLVLLAFSYALQYLGRKVRGWHTLASSLVVLSIIPIFIISSVISIWGHRFDRQEVTQYSTFLPLFFPVKSYSNGDAIAEMFPSLMPAIAGEARVKTKANEGIVEYPISTINCGDENPQSVLMIVLESWQADMLNPDVMPNLWAFSESNYRFEKHISSGSTTIPGLFGLLYGLHSTYYNSFASSAVNNPSQFTELLHERGYLNQVFTTGSLERFALRTLFFSKVAKTDYHEGKDDAEMVERYIASLDDSARIGRPNFDFMFLTSSHSSYFYPEEFEKFTPVPSIAGSYVFDKLADGEPLKNRYRNSLYFLDSLLNRVFQALEARGALQDTLVVITGDHGEAFNESRLGFWGHGSTFSRWQTQVPLVLAAPSYGAHVEERVSLHQDVVPTLLSKALNCKTDPSLYSNGRSLFDLPKKRATVIASYSFNAYWVDDVVYERHSGKKYAWEDVGDRVDSIDAASVRQLWEEENRFFKGDKVNN